MIPSDYFGFGVIASAVSIFVGFSFRHFIRRLRSGSLKFGKHLEIKPLIFDEDGHLIECCSSPVLHNVKNGWCVWCGKSIKDLVLDIDEKLGSVPEPDFNSPTTATVKPLDRDPLDEIFVDQHDEKPFDSSFGSEVTSAFCLRCKTKTTVLDPIFYDQESRRGVRHYLKGSCSVCGYKINAIVKKGGG